MERESGAVRVHQGVKLQTAISKLVDEKLAAYGAYIGLSKNNYIRHLIIKGLAADEREHIPDDLKVRFGG